MYRPKKCMQCGGRMTTYQKGGRFDPITGQWLEDGQSYEMDFMQPPPPKPATPPTYNIPVVENPSRAFSMEDLVGKSGPQMSGQEGQGDLWQTPSGLAPEVQKGVNAMKAEADKQSFGTANMQVGERLPETPAKEETPSPVTKRKNPWTPFMLMRGATAVLTELSGRAERNRQDQYKYNQLSTMGQMNPMQVEDFQPNPGQNLYAEQGGTINPFSAYAKYGGALKKYQAGGTKDSLFREMDLSHHKGQMAASKKYMEGWMNSPMYKEMVKASVEKDDPIGPNSWAAENLMENRETALNQTIGKVREKNDEKTAGVSRALGYVLPNPLNPMNVYRGLTGDWKYNKGKMADPKVHFNSEEDDATYIHEISHASDLNSFLMPDSDKKLIKKLSLANDPMGLNKNLKRREKDWNVTGYYYGTPEETAKMSNYVSNPTETRARLNAVRQFSKEMGIYDPFTQKMTPEHFKKLKDLNYEQANQLLGVYDDDGFMQLMNSVSQNKNTGSANAKYGGRLKKYQGGGKTPSQVWEEKTGTPWSEAKKKGLTTGTAEDNLRLMQQMLSENANAPVSQNQAVSQQAGASYANAPSFAEAFALARKQLGNNAIFEYKGKKFGTNVAGEKLTATAPSVDEVEQPQAPAKKGFIDWEEKKKKIQEVNNLSDMDKIVQYQSTRPDEQYLVVDKKNAKMNLYRGNKLVKSYEVGVGETKTDAQTVTKVKNGKTDWNAGNFATGAGIYTISGRTEKTKSYYDLPSFNMVNENGLEVSTAIHGTPMSRRKNFNDGNVENNRMTSGCVNGKCGDLRDLYYDKKVDKGQKVYVLPEDEGNKFEIVDGKPVLKVASSNRPKYTTYTDKNGRVQKGQGVNMTTNTLNYRPIKTVLDKASFEKDVYQWNDFNDEDEYKNTTKPFVQSIVNNKQKVMKAAKIPSDVYNEIAKVAFGIYGAESNFGDTHSAVGNLGRAAKKVFNAKGSSSPDVQSKYSTYGVDANTNSVGYTQIRWSQLNNDEKKALKEVGVTSNQDFMDPQKSALGTLVILGIRYNQQLTPEEKKDVMSNLPKKWNTRGNYAARVKNNARYLKILEEE